MRYCDDWYARVGCHGERFCLGRFKDEIEAARARDRKAVEVFGESARLNFPEEWPPERRREVHARFQASLKKDAKQGVKGQKGAKARKRA